MAKFWGSFSALPVDFIGIFLYYKVERKENQIAGKMTTSLEGRLMNTFVGAEYVMANTLIALKRKGEESITFERLREIGFQIQTSFNEKGLDAVILTSGDNISAAIFDFSDYFKYDDSDGKPTIFIQKDTTITDLENRFVGYLPVKILGVLLEEINRMVA